jgi:aspartyl aminopeptidase
MVALFDHEEVGSDSAQGAGSPVMLDALSRITSSFDSDPKVRYYLSMTSSSGMKLVIVSILVKL